MVLRYSNTKFLTVLPSLPVEGLGWEVLAISPDDWSTVLSRVPRWKSLSLAISQNDFGSGGIEIDFEDRILTDPLPLGLSGSIVTRECLWQFYENNVLRHEWLGEDSVEDIVTEDGTRVTKISGRTTEKVLEWAKHIPVWGESQTYEITGIPTGGTYKLYFSGQTTATIAYDASAATVKTKLAALTNIRTADIEVTKDIWKYTIQFKGSYASRNVPLVRAKSILLTGGTSPKITIGSSGENTWNDLNGQWTAKPAAAAIVDELTRAQARGVLPFLSLMFDKTRDSYGESWSDLGDLAVAPGESLLALLQRLSATHGWEFKMLPGFRLFVAQGGFGLRHAEEVVLTVGGQQTEHARLGTTRDVATDVYVQSAQFQLAHSSSSSDASTWKRESWYEGGDAASISAASLIGGATLSLVKDRKVGRTVKVLSNGKNRVIFDDYAINDWISIEDETFVKQAVKVVGIALTIDADTAVEVELAIQTKFEARSVKTQRVLSKMGALSATGGAGTSPQRPAEVIRFGRLSDLVDVDVASVNPVEGDALIWDDIDGVWVPGSTTTALVNLDELTDVDLGTPPTNGQTLVFDLVSGLWKPGTISGGGGGGTNKDRRWTVGSAETSVDEFNDSALDVAWVRVDGTGAVLANATWTEDGDALSVISNGADTAAVIHGMMRPLSGAGGALVAGDAFITCLTLMGAALTNYTMGGLVLSDGVTFGAGAQIVSLSYTDTTAKQANDVRQSANWAISTSAGMVTSSPGVPTFVRLVMMSANVWRCDISPDGVLWIKGTATLAYAMTPTHVGFHKTTWGSAVNGVTSYEFLRRVSGVT